MAHEIRYSEDNEITSNDPNGRLYVARQPRFPDPPAERNNGDTVVRVPLEPIEGVSQTRDALRDFIKSRGYTRPGHNVARNAGRGIDH
jgi:hypothetical protein